MADTTITGLSALASPALADVMVIVDDPSGSPTTKKITLANLFTIIDSGDGNAIDSDQIKARDGDGLKLTDDGDNGIFVEDGGLVGIDTVTPDAKLALGTATSSGSGTISSSGTAVTGSGTSFTTELSVGATIIADGKSAMVESITDDTHLTVVSAPASAWSGDAFTYRLPAIRGRYFMIGQHGDMSLGDDFAPESDFHLKENSEHVVDIRIENEYATDSSAPAELVLDRSSVAATQIARIGMDDTSRDFFIRINGNDVLNIDPDGYVGVGKLPVNGLRLDVSGPMKISGGSNQLRIRDSGNSVDTADEWHVEQNDNLLKFTFYDDSGPSWSSHLVVTSAGSVGIGTTDDFGDGDGVIGIHDAGTNPTTNPTNGVILYSDGGELKVRDAAGNISTLSPHTWELIEPSEEMAWSYYSERGGKCINVDMLRLARLVEALSGESLVHIEGIR